MSLKIETSKKEPTLKIDNDTILELQLGDIINIGNPSNELLDNQTFIIEYIDKSKTYLINADTFQRIRLPISPEGIIGDGNIKKIAILSRSDSPSYAIQNGLLPDKWINIHFGGEYPVIITGEITNLENDMIEIETIDKDKIYLNFDYKGLPEDLPIEMIEIREKPSERLTREEIEQLDQEQLEQYQRDKQDEPDQLNNLEEIPQLNVEMKYVDPEKIQLNVPIKQIKDQIREFIVKADSIRFGNESYGPVTQFIDVTSKSERYSIESQTSDLLDELLSTVPNAQRTPRVLNNIHIMIERFKQLRENFSNFDKYGNVEGKLLKESTYKPLIEYFKNFKTNLYWIMPVVKNIKKMYDIEEDLNNSVVINTLTLLDLLNIEELLENYKSNNLQSDQNKYALLYSDLNPYFTPYNLLDNENNSEIISKQNVNENINTITENLEDMYSTVFASGKVKNMRFVIQKYNTALTKLDTIDDTGEKLVTIRRNITPNDEMTIKSFVTLPEPVIRFSKINLPGTSILDKANLNLHFLNYWQLLKTKTYINSIFVNSLENELEFNEQNFANNIKKYVLNLDEEQRKGQTTIEIYNKFIQNIIPKIRVLFNLMKKYITGKLSIVDVVSYLEPYLIYSDDLTFMQYKDIVQFIDEKISQYNKKFIERARIFKTIGNFKMKEHIINSKAFTIIDILDKKLRTEVFTEGYDMNNPESTFTNSEILRKITIRDYSKLYTTALSVQSFPLMFPSEFSNLFSEEKTKIDNKLKKGEVNNKCKNIVIAKYYTSLEQLNNDDKKLVYFDKKYDKTNYGLLEDKDGYEKEVLIMSPEDLKDHIAKDLMNKKRMTEVDADYLANTLVDGHKKVIDGQYAILYKGYNENQANEIDFYIRRENKWELDREVSKSNLNTDESTILCDIQQQCINVPNQFEDKCESIEVDELGLQTQLLKDVMSEFDTKYKISREQLKEIITNQFAYLQSKISILTKIETNNMLKYNNQKYNLGANIEDDKFVRPFSPYKSLVDLIMGQRDFVKKQTDIIRFTNTYTRQSLDGFGPLNEKETDHWLYCIKTGVKLLPIFVYNLADKFITEGQYEYINYLNILKSTIGKESDDGDWWVDKHSGWTICQIDFDFDEGYEEGFKKISRAVIEEDAGDKIRSNVSLKQAIYTSPDAIMINNIINAMSIAMGINIAKQKEFIINCVISSIRDNVESENDYKKNVREMAEKGKSKKMPSYTDFYNTSLLYYTLSMFLIAAQTITPSVKTRKTHPGCIRSFTGYPFESQGDLTSLTYLVCVAYDIRESGEPWNVLKGKKSEAIMKKIKETIDTVLLTNPDVIRKFEEKTDYLLTSPATEIPAEHDIAKWTQFLPPLVSFKITKLANITTQFKKSLLSDLRSGSKNQSEKILVVHSKIINFSLALIEKIQEIVNKQRILLQSENSEPYLENACCESNDEETTISYFSQRSTNITEYNQFVTQLSNMLDDIESYTKAGIFFSLKNTKNIYPEIRNEFNERTIYLAFMYFCKFNSLMPIPPDLLPFCTDKPAYGLINTSDSVDRIIQKLKENGRNYSNEHFLRLLQVIGQHNIVNINLDKEEVSSITKFKNTLKAIADEDTKNDEVVEKTMRELIEKSLDTFDIATEKYTKEVHNLNNFLTDRIEEMKTEIINFIQDNGTSNSSITKMTNTIKNLSKWTADNSTRNEDIQISDDKLYNIINFYKVFIDNMVNVFPNIILNEVNYEDIFIPKYYDFSRTHETKLKKYISSYYEKLQIFYNVPALENILTKIQQTSKNLLFIANNTPSFTSIKLSDDKKIKPVFDERTSRHLFEYYLLCVLINYIDLTDENDMIVKEIKKKIDVTNLVTTEYFEDMETRNDVTINSMNKVNTQIVRGNKKQLKQQTAELLIVFINILNNQKNEIDTSYEEIQDRVFKLREKEKDRVTDRLKGMSDQLREADTILKINKLGMYSKGMQKGLTVLDKNFYDEEQEFRDEMVIAERKIRKTNADADESNIDILLDEAREQQQIDADIERDAYNMEYMNETYYDGNAYGDEEEYDDYQEDN
jgi:hypothetical protein